MTMSHIIKEDERGKIAQHLTLIRDLDYYNHLVNFDQLEIELESYSDCLRVFFFKNTESVFFKEKLFRI